MSDFDPTKNLIPYVFLNDWEKHSLKNWPWGWEFYSFRQGRWSNLDRSAWCDEIVYRGKPKPVVTSLWFNVYPTNVYGNPYKSREIADHNAGQNRIDVLRIDTCNGVSTAHLEK